MNTLESALKEKGYSLIEVLIAFVVLALGITSIVSFQGRLTYDSGLSKARTEAANLANNKLEEFRNYKDLATYDAIASGSDTIGPAGSSATTVIANLTNVYTRTWTVTDNTTYKTINMQTTWPDSGGSASQYTTIALNTNIARIDPTQSILALNTTTTTTTSTTTTTTTDTAATTTTTRASTRR